MADTTLLEALTGQGEALIVLSKLTFVAEQRVLVLHVSFYRE